MMVAQAKTVAVQNLPGLPCYTSEGGDAADDRFDRWIERFHERSQFASWSVEEQLYQLKLHLDKTALDVYHTSPKWKCETINSAITAMNKQFMPSDIEQLRGLEFDHCMSSRRE